MQAKDIDQTEILGILKKDAWTTLWTIQDALSAYPPKVVLAKLKSLKRRGLIDGCCCGCRGDFVLLDR